MRWFQIVINAMEKIKWYKNWLETKKETLDMELTIKWYCCSLAKSHPTLCDPMDCSMPGFPVLHYLLEFAQIHLHWVNYAIYVILCHPLSFCLQSFPASESFPMSQFLSGGQSIGASTSSSVLAMNIQGWFPLGLIGLISLLSKGLSRVFSNTTVQKHQW